MSTDRRLTTGSQWLIAATAAVLGTVATLVLANAVNHSGWSPWGVALGWLVLVGLATMLVKLRHSSGTGMPGPGGHGSLGSGDGPPAGGG
jgi:hypothetical protein